MSRLSACPHVERNTMNGDHQELEYEVLKLLAALKNYQESKKGLYYLNHASDHVLAIIADRPGMIQLMVDLGLAPLHKPLNIGGSYERHPKEGPIHPHEGSPRSKEKASKGHRH